MTFNFLLLCQHLCGIDVFSKLGLNIIPDKSVLVPSQTIEFLGFIIDSVTMTVSLSARKKDKLHKLCQSFKCPGKQFSIREVASFIGKLVSSFPGVEFGPLHYRSLVTTRNITLDCVQGILMLKWFYPRLV